MLKGKNIVLGVCGGIAAYKVVELASRLTKAGALVSVVMTKAATEFVTALTFREITGQPVIVNMWDEPKRWNIEHIALAQRADLFVIAPATANMIAKMAHGIADDMLSTTVLATEAPILVVPAMNNKMFLHPATQDNMKKLREFGYRILDPATGHMACGTFGPGRLPEPICIFEEVQSILQSKQDLIGQRFLITAGGTREAIDPVRYIGNRSSGKMGVALAKMAKERGAEVHLIAGALSIPVPGGIDVTTVENTAEMREAVLRSLPASTVVIKAAAVADYRVIHPEAQKIKKNSELLTLELTKNPDILAEIGRLKTNQIVVGFAAETQELIQNAQKKLEAKNADLIVANDVSQADSTFNSDTNHVKILSRTGQVIDLSLLSKEETANQILDQIVLLLKK